MPDDTPFAVDFLLAQSCLEGQTGAIREFQDTYGPVVMAYLRHAGASENEAEEVTGQLWGDCLMARPGFRPRLATYSGKSSLKSWLHTVALNRLIAKKRKKDLLQSMEDPKDLNDVPAGQDSSASGGSEAVLIEVMRSAVEAGFRDCPAEDFVLLQLAHMDGLHLTELARIFGCSKSKIDRDLDEATKAMGMSILRHVRATDRWLDLSWDDFLELCRVANPACFGTED